MGNSIIEAQETLREETEKEIERCKDYRYFYKNYYSISGRPSTITDTIKYIINRVEYDRDIRRDIENIEGVIELNHKLHLMSKPLL